MTARIDQSELPSADAQRPAATRRLHFIALLTALATFPLIFMGGLVTSNHAGMSVPDWPNSYGYNMFLFPPSQWVGGILYEHTHRLAGTIVGFLSVMLALFAWGVARKPGVRQGLIVATIVSGFWAGLTIAVVTWGSEHLSQRGRDFGNQFAVGAGGLSLVLLVASFASVREPRRWVRWLATGVLGMVLLQGLLGGLRVVLIKLDLAIVHACVAQAFFCLAVLMVVVTSRWWSCVRRDADSSSLDNRGEYFVERAAPARMAPTLTLPRSTGGGDEGNGRRLALLGAATVCVIFLQLIVGATMRHLDAGLAIPDLPLSYGKILPPTSPDVLAAINHQRWVQSLDPLTFTQIWIHFGHRIGAVIVSALILWLTIGILRTQTYRGLRMPAGLLLILLATQLTLGVLTVLLRKPADIASAHVAVGALTLAASFFLTVRLWRLYMPIERSAPRGFPLPDSISPSRPGLVTT
ncbi:MAG TPA: COX15/CtaA family protein [Humisphaera sp.]|nr:COX15/CtaA family protein [Humisphaera sp.]